MQLVQNQLFIEYSLIIFISLFYICKKMLKYLLNLFKKFLQTSENQNKSSDSL
jgi:hypothetical protein